MKVLCTLFLAAAMILTAADINVTGKWSGSFDTVAEDGSNRQSTAVLNLKQNGSDVSGSAGPNEDEQYPISKGKIGGDRLTLEVAHQRGPIKFDLKLTDARLQGEASMLRDGQPATAKVNVTRMK